MRCLKAFGERIAARDPDRQTAEIQIRVALMNRFSAWPAARPSDANLRRAAALAKAEGVMVEVEANGTIFRIVPPQVGLPDDDGLAAWKARRAHRADTRSA